MITIDKKTLKQALTGLGKVKIAGPRHPILDCVLIRQERNRLTLTATNREEHVQFTVDSHSETTEECVVPMKALRDATKAKPHMITVAPDGKKVNITIGPVCVTVESFPVDKFPPLPKTVGKLSNGKAFLPTWRLCSPFASTDETRYMLNGLYVDNDCIVATDGRRLTLKEYKRPATIKEPAIVRSSKFLDWPKLGDNCAIGTSLPSKGTKCFRLTAGPWTYTAKLIDGTYPNYRQVIPAAPGDSRLVFDCDTANQLQEFAANLPADDKSRALIFRPGKAESVRQGNTYTLSLPGNAVVAPKSDGPVFALSPDYLCQALKAGFREFVFVDELSPLRSDNDGATHALMPMRIS
jgi:DNA polymerase-3 subunit beta